MKRIAFLKALPALLFGSVWLKPKEPASIAINVEFGKDRVFIYNGGHLANFEIDCEAKTIRPMHRKIICSGVRIHDSWTLCCEDKV